MNIGENNCDTSHSLIIFTVETNFLSMNKNELTPNSKDNNTREDEIDIGQLFIIIGRGFNNFFNFIGNIFSTLFSWLLTLILFVRSNFKQLAAAAILGGLLGGIYQYTIKEIQFESSMTIEPNFGSAVQLYKNIDYYYSLIEQDDHERLATSLNISMAEAESIARIEVEPYSNKNQILLSYKEFMGNLDSLTINLIDYNTYAKSQPIESFKYHVVKVSSKDKYIFKQLEDPIISSIIQNTYYDNVKSITFSNLISRKNALVSSMSELDSLRSFYKKVLLAESLKESSGTNIYLSESSNSDKEVLIFDKYMLMNQQLIDVNIKLNDKNKVINVVSSFNAIGMKVNTWYKNWALIGFIGGGLIVFIFLGLKKLNQALITYENSLKS